MSTFAADLKLPGIVGASTQQNTMPVRVMDTVNTYFMMCSACGMRKSYLKI